MISRKRSAVAVALAVAGLTLSSCAADGEEGVTLTFLAPEYSEATEPYWEDLIKRFEEENPGVTVELEMVSWDDIKTKINTLVSTEEEPDILNIDSYVAFADDDLLLPVEEVLPEETYKDFTPALLDNATYKDVVYGIPFIASARALLYNKDILAQAGVEVPATWDELMAAAKTITDKTDAIGYGMPLGTPEAFAEFSIWAWNNGGDWKDGDEWVINSPENIETLEYMAKMYSDGLTQTSPWTTKRDDVFRMFGDSQVGIVEGSNFLPAQLREQGSTVSYGIAPSPNKSGEPATLAVEDYLMVFESTEHPKEAGEFLSFLFEAENYSEFLTQHGMLPVTISGAEELADDPDSGPFMELLKDARFYPTTDPNWPAVSQEVISTIGAAVSGEKTAKQVLDELQASAEGLG